MKNLHRKESKPISNLTLSVCLASSLQFAVLLCCFFSSLFVCVSISVYKRKCMCNFHFSPYFSIALLCFAFTTFNTLAPLYPTLVPRIIAKPMHPTAIKSFGLCFHFQAYFTVENDRHQIF